MEYFKGMLDRTGSLFGSAEADRAPTAAAAPENVHGAATMVDKTAEKGTGKQRATGSVGGPLRSAKWAFADALDSGLRALRLHTNSYAMKGLDDGYQDEWDRSRRSQMEYKDDQYETRPLTNSASTIYMSPEQANRHKVAFEKNEEENNVALSHGGKTLAGEKIFVMGPDGSFYAAEENIHPEKGPKRKDAAHRTADMHHSSFLRGGAVAGAGEITANEEGFVNRVSDRSGHYCPGDEQNEQVLWRLQRDGVNLDNVKFDSTRAGATGMAKEYEQGRTTEQFRRRHRLLDTVKKDPRFMERKAAADSDANPWPVAAPAEPAADAPAPVAPAAEATTGD